MNFDFDKTDRSVKVKSIFKSLCIWMVQIGVVILLAYLFVSFGFKKISMVGDSMSPTLVAEDTILVNKITYRFTTPKRFDIIVFRQTGKEHSYYNVKRVVGLPGETVAIRDGKIYINNQMLEEKIEVEPIGNSGITANGYTLEEDEYFVLGDNRNNSVDSRFTSFGTVVKDDIIGKAWIRLNKFAFTSSLNMKPEPTATPK